MTRVLARPIYTQRLRLEPVTPALARAARAGHEAFTEVLGAAAPPEWCEASLSLVARSLDASYAPTRAVAVDRSEGVVVGDVRFEPNLHGESEYEIGYGVAASRRRQGYAVEAVGAIIDWLFDEGAEAIIAGCHHRNVASVRTLRRLGFWLDSNPGRTFWWVLSPELRASTRA